MISEWPLVSIIIPNYNGGEVLRTCLKSILKSSYPNFEIIVVDNNSAEKERKTIKGYFGGKIKMVLSNQNLGYAGGNNLGAKQAKGKYLVFFNNDAVVNKDWLNGPILKMESNAKIGFLQPKIKSLKDKNFFEYAGGAGGYLDFFGYPFVRGRIFGSIEEDIGQYDNECEILWASGVAMFCRKNVFAKLGGFDKLFFAYAEENDLCFRAHRAGYKVIYFPECEVYHLGGYTSNQNIPKKTFLIHRNHLILLIKNLSYTELLMVLPFRFLMDIGSFFYYLVHYRSPKTALGVTNGYLSLMINFGTIINSRYKDKIKKFGYPKNNSSIYKGSIVWQYFFLNRRRWHDILYGGSLKSKLQKIF